MKKTISTIDGKSLVIGTLLAVVVLMGLGATGKVYDWDNEQRWFVKVLDGDPKQPGYEPIGAVNYPSGGYRIVWRKRVQ
ncbi:MAG: hypothetical protein ABGW78_08215 [Pirellulales bacterium]